SIQYSNNEVYMNITPITYQQKNNKTAFSGQIIPNKYLENCIQYTLKSNDTTKTKNLIYSLNTILNDGTERAFEFDAAVKSSAKGLKYAPTVKIDKIPQPLNLHAMFKLQELNNKNLAEECQNSIDAIIKKCEILFNKKTEIITPEKNYIDIIPSKKNNEQQDTCLKTQLEEIYKQIFKKQTKEQT
ncbi:hypothetical protein J6A31_02190, partial [bacterium]|nr:hypothetical protein [bacterium]